jgi:site-specific DNA-methyltransferase (adenine-specific)
MSQYSLGNPPVTIVNGDVLKLYQSWQPPIVIISDGPYGISGFPGDLVTTDNLPEWYEPHIQAWSQISTPQTTLWFWCTELGWATVHPLLKAYGWEYRSCHIWDKGIAHAAGNTNTQSLRKLPVVTEVCVQYTKKAIFRSHQGELSMQEWLRYEWLRTGLPLSKTNEACGVKNAATRKYFTTDHLWYFPPAEAFEKIVTYANTYGNPAGRPYFSVDGVFPLSKETWETYRAKFYCPIGITNVWYEPPVNGSERMKQGGKALHANQKPLKLMELILSISSDPGDLIWEPFGGLCTGAVAAYNLKRACLSAEIDGEVYEAARQRLVNHSQQPHQVELF